MAERLRVRDIDPIDLIAPAHALVEVYFFPAKRTGPVEIDLKRVCLFHCDDVGSPGERSKPVRQWVSLAS